MIFTIKHFTGSRNSVLGRGVGGRGRTAKHDAERLQGAALVAVNLRLCSQVS
jgi:hypothetical protein